MRLEDSGIFRPETNNTGTIGGSSYYWANGYFTNLRIAGGVAWHSGNDGSGSGLDADTLDGIQASGFLTANADGDLRFDDYEELQFGTSTVTGGSYPIRVYYASLENASRVRLSTDLIFDFENDGDRLMNFHRDQASSGCVIFGEATNNDRFTVAKVYCEECCFIGGLRIHDGRTAALLPDGFRNSIVGASARTYSSAYGTDNTCIGYAAGRDMTSGEYNTSVGADAHRGVTTASYSTYVGADSGYYKQSGSYCTALGYRADYYLQNGNNNTTSGYTNTTCLGQDSRISGSNQLQLGNSSVTSYAYGSVQNRSDARDKTDIRDTILGLDFIKSLRPVDFRWDYRDDYYDEVVDEDVVDEFESENIHSRYRLDPVAKDGSRARTRFHHGLVAQDVKETMDEMGIDFAGYQDHSIKDGLDVLSIGYTELIGPMIKAIQEQQAQIEILTAEIQALKNS